MQDRRCVALDNEKQGNLFQTMMVYQRIYRDC